jgi:hypothetical protein
MQEAEHPLGRVICMPLTRRVFVTTFHGTYNFKSKIKKIFIIVYNVKS